MYNKVTKNIVILILLLLLPAQVLGEKPETWVSKFEQLLGKTSGERLRSNPSASSIFSAKQHMKLQKGLEVYIELVLRLWLAGEKDYLIVEWYREKSREKRTAICSVILCDRIQVLLDPIDGNRTDFELAPQRLLPAESMQRKEELRYVVRNAPSISKRIHRVLSTKINARQTFGFEVTAGLSEEKHEKIIKVVDEQLNGEKSTPLSDKQVP